MTLTASIRLTVKQARMLIGNLEIDFGDAGWASLRQAPKTRHRMTHPKNPADLLLSDGDLEIVRVGLFWLLAVMTDVMTATLSAHLSSNTDMRDLLDALK